LGSIVDGLERNWNLGEKFVWRVGSIEGIDASTKDFALLKLAVEKTQTDIIELRKYFKVKDEKVSMEERKHVKR
jgi:hypothetical protein